MDHTLLVSELQSLVTESKRRHPEVKDAGERALEVLKSAQGNELGKHADKLLLPITLGCKTKVGKIVGISISALQRLVTLRSVPTEHLPAVLTTLNSVSGQAVDIQLKLLQTLLSILTFNPDVHDEVLGNALLLCFKLQDSRVSVVSSTAAATLRQAVMLVFDRISSDLTKPTLPLTLSAEPEEQVTLTPSAMDAYNIFADLCLLTAGGGSSGFSLWGGGKEAKPRVLKLNTLQRTFGLELIESVLSGYEEAVKKRPELLHLLKSSLDPLLIKLLSDKPTFPVALRVCRLEFLLIRSFTEKLPLQVEGYLTTLIKLGTGEAEADDTSKKENVYPWLRGLALEIFRGVCGDSRLLRTVWTNFDQTGKSDVFRKMVSSLGKLVNERPVLLGVGAQMHGTGVPSGDGSAASGTYLDMGLGMVSSAASAGLNSVNSMMGSSGGGLGTHSSMKLRLIEQHDKLEAPIIPETYIYLLALQSMDAVAESIYVAAGQTAEPDPVVKGMAESAWPALLAALSFCMGTNLSDGLFAEVLSALQDFTTACGLLGLSTPRDAFFSTLGKYAVPPPAVSAMQSYMDVPTISRASAGMISVDALGLGGPQSATPPALSERNLACLRSVVLTARILASTLGDSWHDVLEVLQNANFMLGAKKPNMPRRPTLASPQLGSTATMGRQSIEGSDQSRPEVFDELDVESIQSAINLLFDGTRDLSDSAFTTFNLALCRLSSEMIGVSDRPANSIDVPSNTLMSPGPRCPTVEAVRRRSSGINISNSIKSGERSYSLGKIRIVAMLNLGRIVNSDPSIGWTTVTQHLLAVARHHTAPSTIRIQASDTLADLLLGAIRVGKSSDVQHHVFDVLVRQVDSEPVSSVLSTDYDVRASGYQTLNQILESSGHSLEVGWKTIFDMLDIVCRDTPSTPLRRTDSQISISSTSARPSTLSKGDVNLVRITFPSLNLICTDFLSSLDPDSMRRCISCLGCFGKQQEDVNITLAAIGLLWNVSDAVQADNKDLWLYLLSVLMSLGQDQRLEVRSSAIQTLFRCIDLYGSTLSSELWEEVFWDVISPLLNVNTADESAILSLTSVGAMFNAFLRTLSTLPSFKRIYRHFLASTETAFASEAKKCVTAGLKALEKTLSTVDFSSASDATSGYIGDETWSAYVRMASAVNGEKAYTQENLVALVRIAGALHPDLERQSDRIPHFSSILRSLLTYSRSPEYRPDIDTVSPLQDAIVKLISSSTVLPPSVVLADLAEFTSLAYLGAGTKVTYVAVSKVCMPIMADVLNKHAKDLGVFSDGTAEAVIGAYALPIKLKYDCPPANKYGEDPPLWRTAMKAFASIVGTVMSSLSTEGLPRDRFDGIWIQIVDLFGGILLADDSILDASVGRAEDDESFIMPILDDIGSHVVPNLPAAPADASKRFAQMLSKASRLYRSDSTSTSGTTSMSIPEPSERMRYWAFDTLNNMANESTKATQRKEDQGEFARVITEIVVDRLGDTLSRFAADSELRGQMPMPRVREEELLYVLRTLATLRIRPDSLMPGKGDSTSNSMLAGPRGHLIKFYPILLRLAFLRGHLPSMWMFPSEYETLFSIETEEAVSQGHGVARVEDKDVDAGDGTDLIEVSARDLVRFCLELVGTEILATPSGAQ